MSNIYVMQRANGDCFSLDDRGRFRVPVFGSSRDAMVARSRNVEMLLFKPVELNSRLLRELVPAGGISEVDFWLVKDPLISLNRGARIERAELASQMSTTDELPTVTRSGNSVPIPIPGTRNQNDRSATETWDDEGGKVREVA